MDSVDWYVHIFEVSDSKENIQGLTALFRQGQAVKAKVRVREGREESEETASGAG